MNESESRQITFLPAQTIHCTLPVWKQWPYLPSSSWTMMPLSKRASTIFVSVHPGVDCLNAPRPRTNYSWKFKFMHGVLQWRGCKMHWMRHTVTITLTTYTLNVTITYIQYRFGNVNGMTSTAMQFIAFAFVLLANLASVDALSSRTMIAHGLLSCEDSSSIAARVEELEGPQK